MIVFILDLIIITIMAVIHNLICVIKNHIYAMMCVVQYKIRKKKIMMMLWDIIFIMLQISCCYTCSRSSVRYIYIYTSFTIIIVQIKWLANNFVIRKLLLDLYIYIYYFFLSCFSSSLYNINGNIKVNL